ncbi:MAG: hypothetical protein AAGJ10_16135 [Bacteroidota bacterium]
MWQRLSARLSGDHARYLSRSTTGKRQAAYRLAWANVVADRALLAWTVIWLMIRVQVRLIHEQRAPSLYEPMTWMGHLLAATFPADVWWWAVWSMSLLATLFCLSRPNRLSPRLLLLCGVLYLLVVEFGFGELRHPNHLFVLAHLYGVARPIGHPSRLGDSEGALLNHAEGFRWYQASLLFVYTLSGCWKWFDMTARRLVRPGPTWLDPESVPVNAVTALRTMDEPLTLVPYLQDVQWVFPIAYVVIAFTFAPAVFAAFRRPMLLVLFPALLFFHLGNHFVLQISFFPTMAVILVVLFPYERLAPLPSGWATITDRQFEGSGLGARYTQTYTNGAVDTLFGFAAYRQRIAERHPLLAAPLYYPGVASLATLWLRSAPPRPRGGS